MTINIANTANNNTFNYWRTRTNDLAYAMSTYAVTTQSNTATGNAAITGTFTASQFNISNTSGTWTINPITVSNNSLTGTLASNTKIDNFKMVDYRGAEYLIHVKDNVNDNRFMSKILLTHDLGVPYTTEYGIILTNTAVGTFDAYANSTDILLNFTPVSTNVTLIFTRILL